MLDAKKIGENIEELSNKFAELVKNSPAKDLEKNMKAGMNTMFNRMDLITRDEFDIQLQVLDAAQTKIIELEQRIAALEQNIANKS